MKVVYLTLFLCATLNGMDDPNDPIAKGVNLLRAAACGDVYAATNLLQKQADPNTTVEQHRASSSPLHEAVKHAGDAGNAKLVKLLLNGNSNPNLAQRQDGATPLMLAAGHGNNAVVQALLEGKADTELQDKQGKRAIEHASEEEVRTLLTKHPQSQ